jgi:hypothetical protein
MRSCTSSTSLSSRRAYSDKKRKTLGSEVSGLIDEMLSDKELDSVDPALVEELHAKPTSAEESLEKFNDIIDPDADPLALELVKLRQEDREAFMVKLCNAVLKMAPMTSDELVHSLQNNDDEVLKRDIEHFEAMMRSTTTTFEDDDYQYSPALTNVAELTSKLDRETVAMMHCATPEEIEEAWSRIGAYGEDAQGNPVVYSLDDFDEETDTPMSVDAPDYWVEKGENVNPAAAGAAAGMAAADRAEVSSSPSSSSAAAAATTTARIDPNERFQLSDEWKAKLTPILGERAIDVLQQESLQTMAHEWDKFQRDTKHVDFAKLEGDAVRPIVDQLCNRTVSPLDALRQLNVDKWMPSGDSGASFQQQVDHASRLDTELRETDHLIERMRRNELNNDEILELIRQYGKQKP